MTNALLCRFRDQAEKLGLIIVPPSTFNHHSTAPVDFSIFLEKPKPSNSCLVIHKQRKASKENQQFTFDLNCKLPDYNEEKHS